MKILNVFVGCVFVLGNIMCLAQSNPQKPEFEGQLSAWGNYSFDNHLYVGLGARYLPKLSYQIPLKKERLLDFEISGNFFGTLQTRPFDTVQTDGDIRAYRTWARYSSKQFELRLGLQKINFGSAATLRPLMWFDQIDPRDPLQLTDGVWGLLGRYYFLNNANIWVWGLYGTKNPRGWEIVKTNRKRPEFGGRVQLPIKKGELGISYHHRDADSRQFPDESLQFSKIPENRVGIDVKWDLTVGFWVEGSWVHKEKDLGILTNQTILNMGTDYTFDLGKGLNVVVEQLLISYDADAFEFSDPSFLTSATMSYPLGIMDNLSTVFYYDWSSDSFFSFFNWERQFKRLTGYFMAYWNPKNRIIQENISSSVFSGKGIQLMLVYNH